MGPTLKDWAKAYQNLCEIVFQSMQSDDLLCLSEHSDLVRSLPGHIKGYNPHVELFPYAMTAYWAVMCSSVTDLKRHEPRDPKIACLNQNYFEATLLFGASAFKAGQVVKVDYLDQIKDLPDILVVDIHPNNAKRAKLYQNDLSGWIQNLPDDRKLTLIIDLTMNFLGDHSCEALLSSLDSRIKSGLIKVHIIQSLAKLIQLGADTLSGGLALSINTHISLEYCHPPTVEKHAFFAELLGPGKDLVKDYIGMVRENTNFAYLSMDEKLREIAHLGVLSPKKSGVQRRAQFCPIDLTLNTDDQTTYLALNFSPLNEFLSLDEVQVEKFVSHLYKTFKEFVYQRGHPLTFRQSFGFTLSNLTTAADALRFSIGIESNVELDKHIKVFQQWVAILTFVASGIDVDRAHVEFEAEGQHPIVKEVERVISWLGLVDGPKAPLILELPVEKCEFDEEYTEHWIHEQNARAVINVSGLRAKFEDRSNPELYLDESCPDDMRYMHLFSRPDLYHIRSISRGDSREQYLLCERDIFHERYMFLPDVEGPFTHQLPGNITITIGDPFKKAESEFIEIIPTEPFKLEWQGQAYLARQAYISGTWFGLGSGLFPISKIIEKRRKELYNLLVKYRVICQQHPSKQGCILVELGEAVAVFDYRSKFINLWKSLRWAGIEEFLLQADRSIGLRQSARADYRSDLSDKGIRKELESYCKELGAYNARRGRTLENCDISRFPTRYRQAFQAGFRMYSLSERFGIRYG
jgi:hypothetical protein